MTKNILVTGASGFVGSHICNELVNRGENVVGLVRDSIPSLWLDEALDNVTLVQGDIRNFGLLKRVIGHYSIDQIYHFAASAQVKEAWKDPIGVFQTNVIGTVNLLEAVRQIDKDIKVLVMQTDKIYGEKLNANEDSPYQSSEPYATSKICQANIVKSYNYTYGLRVVMPSFCNIFGLDLYNSRLIPNTVKQCIRGLEPVIWSNDKSIREYIYVSDVVDSLISLMNFDNEHLTYNISTGWIYNQKEIIENIAGKFGIDCLYNEVDVVKQIQDETMVSIRNDWKFSSSITFDDAIKETIEKFELYKSDWSTETGIINSSNLRRDYTQKGMWTKKNDKK